MFTDIEGSTPLWERNPKAMKIALSRHHAILHQAIESHHGHVFQIVGDSFQAAFALATDALAAAIGAQQGLAQETWGETGPLHVRMGLNTGLGEPLEHDYASTHTLNRVARVMSAAYGEQILLSQETADLVRRDLPPGVSLKDLGDHHLKGLSHPEHLFQVLAPDLRQEFPPLSTQIQRPNNLPPQLTSFVGRKDEIAAIKEKLLQPEVRLLTLTGVGGTGKTRLSIQVGQQLLETFQDGVFFVPLASVYEFQLVDSSIAAALGLRESSEYSPFVLLKEYLAHKQLLLILDNFEQIVEAGPMLSELLSGAPQIKILVTSRTLIRLAAEYDHPVSPLRIPDMSTGISRGDIEENESVQLFLQRARSVKPDFQLTAENAVAVAEICRRLDGLPLAIELAAARCRLFTPQKMQDQLGSRLQLLVGGARDLPERHKTMRAAIDWSYDLLTVEEQTLFRRLAVFAGGCFLEAVEAVCGSEGIDVINGLESLLEKNLIRLSAVNGESRFWMYEIIREYGLRILEASGESDLVRQRHAHYYIVFANHFTQELNRLTTELDNLRAILRWSIDSDRVQLSFRLMNHTWFWANQVSEGRRWLAQLLALPSTPSYAVRRAYSVYSSGRLAIFQGDIQAARAAFSELQSVGNELNNRSLQDLAKIGFALVLLSENHLTEALQILSDLEKNILTGMDWWLIPWVYFTLSTIMVLLQDYDKAKGYLQSSSEIFTQHNQIVGIASCINKGGYIALSEGNFPEAMYNFRDVLELSKTFGMQLGIANGIRGFAGIALGTRHMGRAVRLFGAAEALIKITGSIVIDADEKAINERNLIALRGQLDEISFTLGWEEGEQMNLEDVITYALEGMQDEVDSEN